MKSPHLRRDFERPYRIRHAAMAGSHLGKLATVPALWHIVVWEATKISLKENSQIIGDQARRGLK